MTEMEAQVTAHVTGPQTVGCIAPCIVLFLRFLLCLLALAPAHMEYFSHARLCCVRNVRCGPTRLAASEAQQMPMKCKFTSMAVRISHAAYFCVQKNAQFRPCFSRRRNFINICWAMGRPERERKRTKRRKREKEKVNISVT